MEFLPNTPEKGLENVSKELSGNLVHELSMGALDKIVSDSKNVQRKLSSISIYDRMDAFEDVGNVWMERLGSGEYNSMINDISKTTGYSNKLMTIEMGFVREMFSRENIEKNLRWSFPNSIEGLHGFVEAENGEHYRNMPLGPVFIVSSGNSIIPPLIPTSLSLVTGNLTVLKPSLSNYLGVTTALDILGDVRSKAAKALRNALYISYFTHDSESLGYLLEKAKVGVVNFWGADPARMIIGEKVTRNPHHPKYLINGPLTGIAIIDSESSHDSVARDLALNVVMYDQQLCSSPTQAIFIGGMEEAISFAESTGKHLDSIGGGMKMDMGDAQMLSLQNVRRMLMFKGARVFSSKSSENSWTLVISKGKPSLDEVMTGSPEFNIFNRRRFLEVIVVDGIDEIEGIVEQVPSRPAFFGIDKVQTIGMAVSKANESALLESIPHTGAYRMTSLGDMFMRSPLEPYDGSNIASMFTYTLYFRSKRIPTDVI